MISILVWICMELHNFSSRQSLCNHCHYSLIQGHINSIFSPVSGGSMSPTTSNFTAASLLPSLQFILQQNTMQRVCFCLTAICPLLYILCPEYTFYYLFLQINLDRKKLLDWSSMWKKPLVMLVTLSSFIHCHFNLIFNNLVGFYFICFIQVSMQSRLMLVLTTSYRYILFFSS